MHAQRPPDRLRHHGPDSAYAQEHARLLELLVALDGSREPAESLASMVQLHADLDAHFAEEEAPDGVFTWLATLDPELGPLLRALEADHIALRSEITALIDQASAQPPPEAEAFNAAVRRFSAHLRRHEQQEREVLAKAMDT